MNPFARVRKVSLMHHLIVPSYAGVFNKRATDSRDGVKILQQFRQAGDPNCYKIFKSVGFNAAQC